VVPAVVSAFCGGILEIELANTQETGLDQVNDIEVLYRSEKAALFKGMIIYRGYPLSNLC
jgi:hypothetical protein